MCGYIEGVTCKWCRFDSVDSLKNKQPKYKAYAYCSDQGTPHSGVVRSIANSDDAGAMAAYNVVQQLGFSNTPSGPITRVDCSCQKKTVALGNCNIDVLV